MKVDISRLTPAEKRFLRIIEGRVKTKRKDWRHFKDMSEGKLIGNRIRWYGHISIKNQERTAYNANCLL
jgi:hypothetical protein